MSNELSAEKIRDFFDLPADEAAIRDYLEKVDSNEIARLAASLAPKQAKFDPQTLVEAAMAIQDEVEAAFRRRCEALVEAMNFATLLQLSQELNVYDLVAARDEADARLRDPLVGPVIRRIWPVIVVNSEETHARTQERINEALAASDQRSKVPRPGLPCDLEPALRYATGQVATPWSVLRSAFIDFLGIFRTGREVERVTKRENDLRTQIERVSSILGALVEASVKEAVDAGAILRERERLKSLESALEVRLAHQDYRKNFTPGRVPPAEILAEAQRTFTKYWEGSDSVELEADLAWLSSDFYEFWQRHAREYLALQRRAEHSKRKTSKRNSKAASMAATSRENSRRLAQTRDFFVFLKTRKVLPSDPRIRKFIEDFATGGSGLRTAASQKKAVEFLSLLCNPAVRDFDAAEVNRTLKKCRIGAVSFEGFAKCLDLLGIASGKAPVKKSRKNS